MKGLALRCSAPLLLQAVAILLWVVPALAEPPAKISVETPAQPTNTQLLDTVQHKAFAFFWNESHPQTGLTRDRARNLPGIPDTHTVASIASTGYALASLPVAVERGWIRREDAYQRALMTLRYIHDKFPHVHGFYYHFVDWATGERAWKSELSSIDSALLVLGALAAGQYWWGTEVDRLAGAIYARMDWPWMQRADGANPELRSLSMGWKPETGWLKNRWGRYNEASYLYLLAMGSPAHPIGSDAWDQWEVPTAEVEGYPVFGGPSPLFFAQMTPGYFDLRGLRDRQGRDWWTNFRNEHLANHAYCARNAGKVKTYSPTIWGITASDVPSGYGAHRPVDGKNDGTVAPTAMLSSIFVTPGLAHASLRALWDQYRDRIWGRYGFSNAFNVDKAWYDKDVIGIDLGMMLLAIENHRTGLIWRLMRAHPAVKKGMAAAGMRRPDSRAFLPDAQRLGMGSRRRERARFQPHVHRNAGGEALHLPFDLSLGPFAGQRKRATRRPKPISRCISATRYPASRISSRRPPPMPPAATGGATAKNRATTTTSTAICCFDR